MDVPRFGCACGAVRQAELGFAEPRRRHTKVFARYAPLMEDLRKEIHAQIYRVAYSTGARG